MDDSHFEKLWKNPQQIVKKPILDEYLSKLKIKKPSFNIFYIFQYNFMTKKDTEMYYTLKVIVAREQQGRDTHFQS